MWLPSFFLRETAKLPPQRDPLVQPFKIPEMNVGEVDGLVRACNPTTTWLHEAIKCEKENKNRKGVQSLLEKTFSKLVEPIALEKKICLMPELCDILCIGMSIKGEREILVKGRCCENMMLDRFWAVCNLMQPCGWNISGFDLPVILHRSKDHGLEPTRKFEFTYSGEGFLDLLKLRKQTAGSDRLTDVALALGFDGDGDDPLKSGGADVYEAWSVGRTDDVVAHCMTDLARLEHVFFNYIGVYL